MTKKTQINICGRMVGEEYSPLVIVEIGINHGGDVGVANNMVDLTASSGCERVKHQTHSVEDGITEEAKSTFPHNANKSKFSEK